MNQQGNNYNILYAQNSVKTVLVFILGTIVYLRTRRFNFETVSFIQLTFSLGWLIEFYILAPEEITSFTITYAMLLIFPISLFLFYSSFTHVKNKFLVFSGVLLILLSNILDPNQLPWEYSLITSIILCFLLFFHTRFTVHYHNWKYQKILLFTLLITFIPYLVLQNISLFLSDPPKWIESLVYVYKLPNYFLLIFPIVLGYRLIKNNELEFTLSIRDYSIQLFFSGVLIGLVAMFALKFLKIPYGALMILLLSIYLVYLIVLTWQQQYFFYRYKHIEAEGINNKIKLIKRVSYGYRNFYNLRDRIYIAKGLIFQQT